MYCSHFGLQRLPFNNTPDPTFYYSTPDHEEALATLQYATQQRKGFVLVSGEIGAGKTLIGRIFLRQMDANSTTAVISQTNLTGRQLLAAICTEFGLPAPAEATNLELTQRLQDFLVEQFARNRFVVVLLDEAQNLPDESFEELRMLGNLEADDAKLLQVCILGQPELRERFGRPGMKQLEQRLFRRFHLPSLNRVQTGEYIIHRLGVAGGRSEQLFTVGAVERIYEASGGVPRLINQICDNALLTAYGQDATAVDGRLIDLVIERDTSLVLPGAMAASRQSSITASASADRPERAADEAVDSVHLAELALEQTQHLCSEVAAIASHAEPLRNELDKISERQGELHKIVAGATTRWLAAKEKLEEYRKEIQSEIREVIVRCHHTQERLQEVERTAAPAEDLDEIRENHLRETNRLLKLMQAQREDFQSRLEEVHSQWTASEQELRRMAAQARSDERFTELRNQCEAATRDVLGTVDRHRQSMMEHLGAMRQQCDAAQAQLHGAQSMFDRRIAEADRRVEQLRTDWTTHEKDLTALREQLDGWRRTMQNAVDELKTQVHSLQDNDEQDQDRQRALAQLRREQSAAASDLARRLDEQSAALQEFRRTLDENSAASDLLHRKSIEQIALRTAELEARLDQWRQELTTEERVTQAQLDELERAWQARFAERDHAWQNQLDQRERAFHEELERREAELASTDSLEQVRHDQSDQATRIQAVEGVSTQLQRGLGDLARQVEHENAALQSDIQGVRKQVTGVENRLDDLAVFRDQQTHTTELVLRQLQDQRRSMREEYDALSQLYRGLESGLEQLGGKTATREELDNLHTRQAADVESLRSAVSQQEQELDLLADRLREQTEALSVRLDGLVQDAARAEDVSAIQRVIDEQIKTLAQALSERQAQWSEAFAESRQRADQTAAALLKLARQAATQEQLTAVHERHQQFEARIRAEVDDRAARQQEQVRQIADALEQGINQMQVKTSEQIQQIQARQRELQDQTRQELDKCYAAQQEQSRLLAEQITETEHQATDRYAMLQARLGRTDEEQVRLQSEMDRLRSSSAEQVTQLHKRLSQAAVAQTARLEREIGAVHDALQQGVSSVQEQIAHVESQQQESDHKLQEQIRDEQARHEAAVADLNGRWEALRASLEELALDTVPMERFDRVQQSLTADVSQLRHQLTDATTHHTQALRTLVEKVQETAGRVTTLETTPPPRLVELQPEVMAGLSKLVETAESERVSLRETLERAGAISAHFRNCSSQVQEIMEHWMSSAGEVREQSNGLRASAESSKGILEAMRRCNTVLEAKFNSQRWRSQLERGEALAGRIEQAVGNAQSVVRRLESLLADFDAARSDIDVWEQRHRQAQESAGRLAQLLDQAQSRQRLLAAVAKNTSQLVDVIQAARVEDETYRPAATAPSRDVPRGNGHGARGTARIAWPQVHAPAGA